MSVSGASSSSHAFGRFQNLMKDLNTAVDSRQGKNVTGPQAQKIVQEFEQLQGAEKLVASQALKAFLQNDVFQVTDSARDTFAKALGVDAASLKPQAAASGTKRKVMEHAFRVLGGAKKIDAAMLKDLFGAMGNMPKEIGDFLTASIKKGGEQGDIKLEPDARKEYVKEVAQRNQGGAVDHLAAKFGDDFANRVPPYLLEMMSTPPLFEELIFILMITLVSDTQKEVLEEQAKIQRVVDTDQKTAKLKEDTQKAIDTGLAKKGAANAEGGGGGSDPVNVDAFNAERHRLAHTKGKLEAFVQAVDASARDDGKIDPNESKALAAKLERSFPAGHPARQLLAEAIGTAITHKADGPRGEGPPELQPFLDWAKQASGLEEFPKPTVANPGDSLSEALMKSDKLEQRLAGFLVDSLGKGAVPGEKSAVERMQPVLQEIVSANEPGLAGKGKTEAAILARYQRLVTANDTIKEKSGGKKELDVDKGLALALDREMPNATPEEKASIGEAVKKSFEALPKKGAATAADIDKSYRAARDTLVDSVLKDDPVVQGAEQALIGRSVDDAIRAANDGIKNREDGKAPLSKDEKRALLEQSLGVERHQVVEEAKSNGYTDAQAEALGAVFDKRADQVRARFEKNGKVEPENKNGMGSESVDPNESNDTRSRQIMFEQLKFKMNMLSEMMQSMSNILNTMHQNAENTIRAIR